MMLKKLVIGKIDALAFMLLFIALYSVEQWSEVKLMPTVGWWISFTLFLVLCFGTRLRKKSGYFRVPIISLFLLLVSLSFLYGAAFKAENYWDWKNLIGNTMVFLLPMASYSYARPKVLARSLNIYLVISCILIVPIIVLTTSDAVGRFLAPYCLLALFLPFLNEKSVILVVVSFFITVFAGHESRSDIVKFAFALILGIMTMTPFVKRVFLSFRKVIYFILMLLPFLFFGLAAVGVFNIFQLEDELGITDKYQMKAEYYAEGEASVLDDTRSFIYIEEISSAINNGYVILGRSPARGYDSDFFGGKIDVDLNTNRGERSSCEVSVLNIFNYFGVIGVMVYFLIFAMAAYMAVFRTKNSFMPSVGLFVAFRWCFAWIEDFTKFDLNYLFLWICIGMCFSPVFLNMTDVEFKRWLLALRINHDKK